jgi:hypothetical protein
VLEQHIAYLKRAATVDPAGPADDIEVVDDEGRRRIVDLLLSRSIERAEDQRQHLVVELKRPSVKVGPDELQQLKNYALVIAKDARFDLQIFSAHAGSSGSCQARFVGPQTKNDGSIRTNSASPAHFRAGGFGSGSRPGGRSSTTPNTV